MNSLVIGASGLVGSYIFKLAPEGSKVTGTFHNFSLPGLIKLELGDQQELEKLARGHKPDIVFLPAAMTNVDICQESPELCYKINVEGTRILADTLKGLKTKLVYFSTDYIFNGQNGPYSENGPACPLSVYGKSKLEAEKIIEATVKNHLIIRTTCIYGQEPQKKNFVVNLIKNNKAGKATRVPADQVTTPTYAGHLARFSWDLVKKDKTGIYNIAGATLINRFDFALLAAEVFGLDKKLIIPIDTAEMNRPAKRPLNAGLKTDKLKQELKTEIPTAKEGLQAMRKENE